MLRLLHRVIKMSTSIIKSFIVRRLAEVHMFGDSLLSILTVVLKRPSMIGSLHWSCSVIGGKLYYYIAALFNWFEYAAHKQIYAELKPTVKANFSIDKSGGYTIEDLNKNPLAVNAISAASTLLESINWQTKKSQKSFLLSYRVHPDEEHAEAIYRFALSPSLVIAVADYLGTLPILSSVSLLYSPNTEFAGRSQLFHFDGHELKQVKCFVMLDEITEDSGPFHFIPAQYTDKKFRRAIKRLTGQRCLQSLKYPDEIIYQAVARDTVVRCTGTRGTVSIVDTARCMHYGSRPGTRPRKILALLYVTPCASDIPLWGREPIRRNNLNDYHDLIQRIADPSLPDGYYRRLIALRKNIPYY